MKKILSALIFLAFAACASAQYKDRPYGPPAIPLSIATTGTWQFTTPMLVLGGENLQITGSSAFNPAGAWLGSFTYTESPYIPYGLTSFSFNNLQGLTGPYSTQTVIATGTISYPTLVYCGGAFTCVTAVTSGLVTAPQLNYTGGAMSLTGYSFSFPSLVSINGALSFNLSTTGSSVYMPLLNYVNGSITSLNMGVASSLSFPSLTYVLGSSFNISGTNLSTISIPNLISAPSLGYTLNSGLGNLTSVVLGTIGTLKNIGGNINIAGQKLTQASVDAILAILASLDGTNGTVSWGTGKTLTINGGTNAAPSSSGSTSMATIVARGGTVTHN